MALQVQNDPAPDGRTRVFITASEAYPAFEDAVLDAEDEVFAGFRIFDLSTPLVGSRARAVGQDWFDLLLHTVSRGVRVRLILSDFDPVVAEALHASTWRTLRLAAALREVAPAGAVFETHAALHPARLAWPVRLALWPRVQKMLEARIRELDAMPDAARVNLLRDRPGLLAHLVRQKNSHRPRRLRLPELVPVTHHQKVAVIDGRRVYCGGLDLNARRYDDWNHDRPAEETWHDVQLLRDDPETAAATRAHLIDFVAVTHRAADPPPGPPVVLRTLSSRAPGTPRLFSPQTVLSELEEAILDGIASARDLIYLETQFMRDRLIARALASAARARPGLRLFLVLPGAPEDVAFFGSRRADARFGEYLQARAVRKLRRAFGARTFIGAPAQRRPARSRGRDTLHGAPLIYVHAKVCLFDDDRGLISSANLNGRSLRWDTEFGVPLRGAAEVAATRRRLLQHWLGEGESGPLLEGESCVAAWRELAGKNAARAPEHRRGLLVPYPSGPGLRLGRDLPVVPDEMV
ncbi:phospholipase D family protein [Jannaschia formosa]|uniref:phospholipase D family protein n=1 Tax=Jannaschia formosa TaxID=2259592 RepID=UPI000E1B68BE|nr:phospholipase D-like domain-containing protein [Jannaschia formosa]TFL17663.1 phospholipase [Jannaschia formosa]